MPPNSPFKQTQEDHLQQALFVELLRLAPEGAKLYITSDSWEELPTLLGGRMTVVNENNYPYWVVALMPESRVFLEKQALQEDIHVKLVHFTITVSQHELVESYDRMATVTLHPDFPAYERLMATYAPILML
jgi:hypothetical protein